MIYCFWILSLLFYFYCILYIRHLHLIFLLYCYVLFFSCLCCFSSIIYSCAAVSRSRDQQFRPPQNRAAFSNTLFLNGFYITKKYHINVYYTYLKLFVYIGYIDIKIEY